MMESIEPSQWIVDLTDRAAYLRGRYLTSFAQCEFLLADLSVKIDNRFRYSLEKRVSAAKTMAESNGALNQYAEDLVPLLDHLTTWSERRHWLAHGFLTFISDKKGNHLFEFRRYVQEDGGKLVLMTWQATIDDLQDAADAINRYCAAFVKLHELIYRDKSLNSGDGRSQRIAIELINLPFLRAGGSADEYRTGIERAIAKGWLWRHESGVYVHRNRRRAVRLMTWRHLQSDNIKFTIKRLREPIDAYNRRGLKVKGK